jgi:GNAT superfamily N-acetyltransferase
MMDEREGGIEIRGCGPERAEEIRWICLSAFRSQRHLDPAPGAFRETLQDVRAELAAGGAAIAELGGRPVGALRWAITANGELAVHRLGVTEGHQGSGIGRALMEWAESEGRRRGCDAVAVGVRVGVPGALAFYRRLGFEIVSEERHDGYDWTTWNSMRKRISASRPRDSGVSGDDLATSFDDTRRPSP